ncbi:hypothetical protein N1031_13295 [Herbiconiux moechotypicola]|uniref:Uncharacterized protein n=1 Tax=Herbiconiux moechotypicola TaxID=637393 RepID=A0ABN3DWP7_9MICO|nr:hypothetical protein [Herbiconiux moechotypicola]MCS5730739.1 hypothetical protein [Herbiconiux moechotypicola]
MSTSDPFLPFPDPVPLPGDGPDPRDHDLDHDTDVDDERAVSDSDAEKAAERAREHNAGTPFRRPEAGSRLSAEELARELGGENTEA